MPLKIKADEDLPGSVAVRLRRADYLVETVVEEGMGGTKDPALCSSAFCGSDHEKQIRFRVNVRIPRSAITKSSWNQPPIP